MSVIHWSLTHRLHADSLLPRLRIAAAGIIAVLTRRRQRSEKVIRVPPISVEWVRAHESRKRGDVAGL
jgi:hypothetical protein